MSWNLRDFIGKRPAVTAPLNFKSILVVTYGRSGSTLLQGVVNSIDNVVLKGENNNFIFDLFGAYVRLKLAKEDQYNEDAISPTHPWYGAPSIDLDVFTRNCKRLIRDVILGSEAKTDGICYGFKEIRYLDIEDNLFPYLDFLQSVMPDVCIIFNTRNLDAVVRSGWWQIENPDEVRQKIGLLEQRFAAYHAQHPERSFPIRYEDVIENGERLRRLFEFLGADYNKERIDSILKVAHSVSSADAQVEDQSNSAVTS